MFKPLMPDGLTYWDGTNIQTGRSGRKDLSAALGAARVVVVLVSSEFFASPLASSPELSTLLTTAQRDPQITVTWIPVGACFWESSAFAKYQPAHEATRPLITLPPNEIDAALKVICENIHAIAIAFLTPISDTPASNPYRGLSAFQVKDTHLFFGREELTKKLRRRFNDLYRNPNQTRLLTILGPSGSGKSSVTLAGLVAALQTRQMSEMENPSLQIVIFKPGDRPIENLAKVLVPLLPTDSVALPADRQIAIEQLLRNSDVPAEGLRRFATALPTVHAAPLVVVVDQFEEIYTLCSTAQERNTFVESLLHAANDVNPHVSIILTLRSDFFGETQRQHPQLNRAIAEQHELVAVMSPDEMRSAITEPARQAGQPLDSAVVDLLLAQARDSEGSLPLLEFALTQIWVGIGTGQEPTATLELIGGVGGALAKEAERLYESLGSNDRHVARRAFLGLLQLGEGARDTRRRTAILDLVGHGETLEQVKSVLLRFADKEKRLVTLSWDYEKNCEIAEVTHEALFENWSRFQTWIDAGRDNIRFHRRLEEQTRVWVQHGRPKGALWRSPDLDLLRKFAQDEKQIMTAMQIEFFNCAVDLEKEERSARELPVRILLAATVLAGLLLLALGWQIRKEQISRRLAERATAAAKGLSASVLAPERDIKALVAGIQAVAPILLAGEQPPIEAEGGLITAVLTKGYMTWRSVQHNGVVYSADFSPDGQHVMTAGEDGTVRMLQTDSGRELFRMAGHKEPVLSAVFSPSGKQVATASRDGIIRVFNAETGSPQFTLRGHEGPVRSVSYSSSGRWLVSASDDSTARIWDAMQGTPSHTLIGHTEPVVNAVMSDDEQEVATASQDGTARLWQVNSGQLLLMFDKHKDRLTNIEYDPEGRRLLTSSFDGTARIWDRHSGKEIFHLPHPNSWVFGASFAHDGRYVLTRGSSGAHLWELPATEQILESKPIDNNILYSNQIHTASFAANDQLIFIGTGSSIYPYRVPKLNIVSRFPVAESEVSVVHADKTGSRILAAYRDGAVRLFLVGNVGLGHSFDAKVSSTELATNLRFSPDGQTLLVESSPRNLEFFSRRTQVELESENIYRIVSADNSSPQAKFTGKKALFSQNGRRLLVFGKDAFLIVDVKSGLVQRRVHISPSILAKTTTIDWSPDERLLALGGAEEGVALLDAQSGAWIRTLSTDGAASPQAWLSAQVSVLAFSPDGEQLITGNSNGMVQIWNVQSGYQLSEPLKHRGPITCVTYSSDGKQFLTASPGQSSQIWSTPPVVQRVAQLKGGSLPVSRARFTNDSKRVLTDNGKESILWDIKTEQEVSRLTDQRSVDVSPDGRQLAILNISGNVDVRSLALKNLVEDSCYLLRYNIVYQDVQKLCEKFVRSPSPRMQP